MFSCTCHLFRNYVFLHDHRLFLLDGTDSEDDLFLQKNKVAEASEVRFTLAREGVALFVQNSEEKYVLGARATGRELRMLAKRSE